MGTPFDSEANYLSVVEQGRTPEGVWYNAMLRDGSPVAVVALSEALGVRVSDFEAFARELERASAVTIEGAARPIFWGKTDVGIVHCAFGRNVDVSEMAAGQWPPAEVAVVGVHLARTLHAIHRAGLLHGALSTVRIQHAGDSVDLTALGLHAGLSAGGLGANGAAMVMSDPAYLSPEVPAGAPMDVRSDVYALGAVLYELITGKPPFGGRTTSYVMASVLSESESSTAVPEAVDPVVEAVLRAIERAPEDRWPTAAAFGQALAAGAGPAGQEKDRSLRDIFKTAWFSARRSRE